MNTIDILPCTNSTTLAALEAAKEALRLAKEAHERSLPVCPAEKVRELVDIERKLDITPEEAKRVKEIKEAYRFRDEEKDQLGAAKAARLREASTRENRVRFARAMLRGHFKDARRRLRADGRTIVTVRAVV